MSPNSIFSLFVLFFIKEKVLPGLFRIVLSALFSLNLKSFERVSVRYQTQYPFSH